MIQAPPFVVVGAGMAGVRAAAALRDEGFDGRVVLLGDEAARPYDRVPLSKYYLRDATGPHPLFLHGEDYYAARDIEVCPSTAVTSLDIAARQVTTDTGEHIDFRALLLATGSEARRLHCAGSDLARVFYLRTLADADALRDALHTAARIVIIGGGWIGCEVAASARELGIDVAVVGRSPLPLQAALGAPMARFYRDLHVAHGVQWHLGTGVDSLRGRGTVSEVVLGDGTVLQADAVVVGIGATPRTELAAAAGLAVQDGIATDERLATSAPGIYAAGDVADTWHPLLGRRVRLEHWSAALRQGPAAARAMLGQRVSYARVPFFFSDQYDVWMEYTGDATGADRLVVRTLPGENMFIAFYLRGGRIVAGMNVGIKGVPTTIEALIVGNAAVDPDVLADPDVDLAGLVPPPREP